MIAWYVHHHGWGHMTRMQAIRPYLADEVTVFSSLPEPASLAPRTTWVQLPSDSDPVIGADGVRREAHELGDVTANGSLHWAPLGHPGHQARLSAIADWVAVHPTAAFVVDVSVEITMLARLMGVPTIVFAQPGERTDAPHRLGYDLADLILMPWPQGTIEATGLVGRERVRAVGGVSRYDGRARPDTDDHLDRRVLFLGRALDGDRLAETIALLGADGWTVESAGANGDDRIDDVWPLLCRATVVVSAAGQNSVADLAAADARAVVIAQERPFGEQEDMARVLAAQGYAQSLPIDATPSEIVDGIRRAADTAPRWDAWQVGGAAARAASAIEELAR